MRCYFVFCLDKRKELEDNHGTSTIDNKYRPNYTLKDNPESLPHVVRGSVRYPSQLSMINKQHRWPQRRSLCKCVAQSLSHLSAIAPGTHTLPSPCLRASPQLPTPTTVCGPSTEHQNTHI